MESQILTIIGAPGTGKSFLARKLAEKLNAKLFLEGEIDNFPPEILKKLEQNICDLPVFMWFRNKLVKEMEEARKLSSQKQTVILDTFWKTDECYLDLIENSEENKKAVEICKADTKTLTLPDKIILLKASENTLRRLMQERGRYFEDENVIQTNLFLAKKYDELFTPKSFGDRLIVVNRDKLDFSKEDDLNRIVIKL